MKISAKEIITASALCIITVLASAAAYYGFSSFPEFRSFWNALVSLESRHSVYDGASEGLGGFFLPPTLLVMLKSFDSMQIEHAYLIFLFFSGASALYLYWSASAVQKSFTSRSALFPVMISLPIFASDLLRGSPVPILLAASLLAVHLILRRHEFFGGAVLAGIFHLFPSLIILLLPVMICGKWRVLLSLLIVYVLVWAVFIPLAGGPVEAGTLVLDWFASLKTDAVFPGEPGSLASLIALFGHITPDLLFAGAVFVLAAFTVNPICIRYQNDLQCSRKLPLLTASVLALLPALLQSGTSLHLLQFPLLCCLFSVRHTSKKQAVLYLLGILYSAGSLPVIWAHAVSGAAGFILTALAVDSVADEDVTAKQ